MKKKENILYLRKMGCDDNTITGDIKNHRVRVIENVDIIYHGKQYNLFFEFMQGVHWHFRYTNKRNGNMLKKPVYEVDLLNGLYLDTEYEEMKDNFLHSFRLSSLEREIWKEHNEFSSVGILHAVNMYKVGPAFDRVVLIEDAATDIIRKCGGFREKDILNDDSYFGVGDTWNDEHKIVKVVKRSDKNFCEVDIVTGRITG